MRRVLPALLLLLTGCDATQPSAVANGQREDRHDFPNADRPVATIVSGACSIDCSTGQTRSCS